MDLRTIRHTVSEHGILAGLHTFSKRAANRVVPLRILRGVRLTLRSLNRDYLALPDGFTGSFLDDAMLEQLAVEPRHELDDEFLSDARSKGDRCYALFEQGRLAAYGWYSREPSNITASLVLHFDPAYTYMYKGLTLPEYRGKRLHAVGMARALAAYTESGAQGILSYVDSSNYPSLISCARMGYTTVGSLYAVGSSGRQYTWATGDCAKYGLLLEPVSASSFAKAADVDTLRAAVRPIM